MLSFVYKYILKSMGELNADKPMEGQNFLTYLLDSLG